MDASISSRAFRWSWIALYVLAALIVTHSFAHFAGLEKSRRASLEMMVNGTAYRPFVSRALVPYMIRAADHVPELLQDTVWEIVSKTGFHPEFFVWNYHEFVFECIAFVCFFLTALLARRAYAIAFRAPPVESSIAALIYLLAVTLWFRYFNYIYDPASVVLSIAMVYAILSKRPWFFATAFLLACVNKETALMTLPVWAYASWIDGRRKQAILTSVPLGIAGVAIRLAIMHSTANNPGVNMEWHWEDHMMVLLRYTYGSALYSGLVLLAEMGLIFHNWKKKPFVLRFGFLFTFIPLFVLSWFSGYIDELRALYDVYPYVMLLALVTFCETLGIRRDRVAPAVVAAP